MATSANGRSVHQRPRAPSPPRSPINHTGDNFSRLRQQQQNLQRSQSRNNISDFNKNAFSTNGHDDNGIDDSGDESNAYSSVHGEEHVMNRPSSILPPKKNVSQSQYPPPRSFSSGQSSSAKANRMFGDSVQHSEESDASSIHVGNNSRNDTNNNRLLNARELSSSAGRQNLMNGVRKMSKGGSVSSNASSVMSAASGASSSSIAGKRGGNLANIYQARKNSVSYDATTVNQIKAQFQAQIESMLQSQERNNQGNAVASPSKNLNSGKPSFRTSIGHMQSTTEKELNTIKDIQRGKSFDEARNAVQKQIERIFSNNHLNGGPVGSASNSNGLSSNNPLTGGPNKDRLNANDLSNLHHGHMLLHNPVTGAKLNPNGNGMMVKHSMHGVSHALPGELDDDIRPPPIHYGINQAIRTRNGQGNISYPESQSRSNDDLSFNRNNKHSLQEDDAFDVSQPHRRLGLSHESLLDTNDRITNSMSVGNFAINSSNPLSSSSPRLNRTSLSKDIESPSFNSASNQHFNSSSALNEMNGRIQRTQENGFNSNAPLSNRSVISGSGMALGNIDINVRKPSMSLQSGGGLPSSSSSKINESRVHGIGDSRPSTSSSSNSHGTSNQDDGRNDDIGTITATPQSSLFSPQTSLTAASLSNENSSSHSLSPQPTDPREKSVTSQSRSSAKPTAVPGNGKPPYRKEFIRHKVDYLGSLPISTKSTNLAALQRPLKDLYFKYRAMQNLGQTNLPGTLEITDTGLTVQYIRELHKGVQEIFNPFPTIAVWAAVKFVHRRELENGGHRSDTPGSVRHRFAFLPLISDPVGNDKMRLFHDLDGDHEVELAADSPHPPVFACVMRKMTGNRGNNGSSHGSGKQQTQLECHGFVCSSSEDAIIIAANLYQALLETMKKQKIRIQQQQRQEQQRRKEISAGLDRNSGPSSLSNRNPIDRTPSARRTGGNRPPSRVGRPLSRAGRGDTDSESMVSRNHNRSEAPIRPPRRKKLGYRSGGTSGSEYSTSGPPIGVPGSILQRRRSIRSSIRSNRSNRSNRGRSGPISMPTKSVNTRNYGDVDNKMPPRSQGVDRRTQAYGGYNPDNRYKGPQSLNSGLLNRSDSRRSSRRAVVAASTAAVRSQYHKQASIPKYGGKMNSIQNKPEIGTSGGDLYTRVAIPRSRSFMNVNSQYNLQELFRELKEKEGVESIDDVLKKIISPNGISFNEIKPVYRELLLKLAMTMSQDEIFQRSKNILNAEKKNKKKEDKKTSNSLNKKEQKSKAKQSNKKVYTSQSTLGGRASEQSTLSSFLKMTFSSKNKDNANRAASSNNKSSSGYESGMSVAPHNNANISKGYHISKADISGPMDVPTRLKNNEFKNIEKPPKGKNLSAPLPPAPVQNKSKAQSSTVKQKCDHPTKPGKAGESESSVDDAYGSCSECGYDSVCTYESCSCAGGSTTHYGKSIPPPKQYQSNPPTSQKGPISPTNKHDLISKAEHEHHPSDCDCETDSCIYSEKCYCSLRGDPRGVVHSSSKPSIKQFVDSNSYNCDCSDAKDHHTGCESSLGTEGTGTTATTTEDDSGTDTTCYSVRHVIPAMVHKNADNNHRDNNKSHAHSCQGSDCDITTDTYSEALPISNLKKRGTSGSIRSVSVSGSTSGSSASASCRECQMNSRSHSHSESDKRTHSSPSYMDEDSSSEFSRKNSGGSGYQSNDSYSSPHVGKNHDRQYFKRNESHRMKSQSQNNLSNMKNHGYNTGNHKGGDRCSSTGHSGNSSSSCCSCGSSCAMSASSLSGTLRRRYREPPKLSLARSSPHLLDGLDDNFMPIPDGLSNQSPSAGSPNRVLVVSAVDKSGKVMYRGTSNTRLNAIDSSHPIHGHPHSYSSSSKVNGGRGHTTSSSSRAPSNQNIPPPPNKPNMNSNNSHRENTNDNSAADANIMHMKKSAEIAALFSGAKINQTTDILDPVHQHSKTNENYNGDRNRFRQAPGGDNKSRLSNKTSSSNNRNKSPHSLVHQEMFSEADMHSSLGYFP